MWGGRTLGNLVCQMPDWEGRWLSGGAEGWINDGMGGWVDERVDGWEEESSVTSCAGKARIDGKPGSWAGNWMDD